MTCEICEAIKNKKGIIYEDNFVVALLASTPAAIGHIWITSKEHHTIMEEVPDNVLANCFNVANKLSMLIFEGLGAHGTNLVIENGAVAGQKAPHFLLNIVPRKENDGLQLQWQPKELSEDELGTAELQLKQVADTVGVPTETKKPETIEEAPTEEITSEDGEDDYRIKHLERLP